MDKVREHMQVVDMTEEDAEDRKRWKRMIRCGEEGGQARCRRRADRLSAAAARRCQKIGGGGADKMSAAAARRDRRRLLVP
jgi:hypothetical protein